MSLQPSIRGEVSAKIGEKDYRLRLGFAELERLESETGLMVVEIAESIARRKLSVKMAATLFHLGLIGSKSINPTTGQQYTFQEIGDLIADEGILPFLPVVGSLLIGAVSGGKGAENAAGKATGVQPAP